MQFSTFTFAQQHNVRAFEQNGLTWFVAADVCAALEIVNHKDAISKLDDDEKAETEIQTAGGKQSVRIINESGLYILILRSRKAMEKGTVQHKFRKWVTNEVLPQIRKTGSYTVSSSLKAKTTVDERTGLRDAVNALVGKRGLSYSEAYQMVHQRFGVGHIDELPRTKIKQAVEYVHRITLDGEVLDKEPLLTESEFKALMHMFAKLGTYTLTLRDLQKNLMLKPEKLSYWFSGLTNAPEEGFLFFFNPNINRDLDDAANIIRRHKHLIA